MNSLPKRVEVFWSSSWSKGHHYDHHHHHQDHHQDDDNRHPHHHQRKKIEDCWSHSWSKSKAIDTELVGIGDAPSPTKLVPAHEIHRRFKYFWQYLQFSPRAARIFANIEYWPLLNADELAPNIEYWLYIERGDIILRHSINQFPKTRNFDVIRTEMMNTSKLKKTRIAQNRTCKSIDQSLTSSEACCNK